MFVRDAQRGQALVETALFLPIALLAMFAVIYFSRFGVINERAQAAVRYGTLVSYNTVPVYSVKDIYNAINTGGVAPTTCPSNVVTDIGKALTQSLPGMTKAQSYWSPDGTVPTPTCAVSTIGFGGASFEAYHYFTVTTSSVSAPVYAPAFLSAIIGNANASATAGYLHADPPSIIMYCTNHVGSSVSAALGFAYTPPNPSPC